MNNELIEKGGDAVFNANLEYAERCTNDEEEYSDDKWAENQFKAALKVLEDEGYVSIDELIDKAERQKNEFRLKAGFDRMGMAAHAETWLKEIKTERKG